MIGEGQGMKITACGNGVHGLCYYRYGVPHGKPEAGAAEYQTPGLVFSEFCFAKLHGREKASVFMETRGSRVRTRAVRQLVLCGKPLMRGKGRRVSKNQEALYG
jgi:hypothetical protein